MTADGSRESRKSEALEATMVRWARESQLARKVALHTKAEVFFRFAASSALAVLPRPAAPKGW